MRKIRRAAVIGSGVMGGGIAALLASAGVETILLDIVPPDLKDDAKKDQRLIDATHGRRTRSIIIMDSNHIILSAIQAETISQRFTLLKENNG